MDEGYWYLFLLSLCGIFFFLVAFKALRNEKPINFFMGIKLNKEDIRDIKAYNRANALMWSAYGVVFIISGLIGSFYKLGLGLAIALLGLTMGTGALILIYGSIYRKYKI